VAPVSTPAVLLRAHDYGDTSRILRFYTRDRGLLSVMARGVRGRSGKGATTLASFASGELTAYVRPQRDLHTMKDFACRRTREGLGRDMVRLGGASAIAELLLAHAEHEEHHELFDTLEAALDLLEAIDEQGVPGAALSGLWVVTEALGFAPQLDACVMCGAALDGEEMGRFDLGAGGMRCPSCAVDGGGPRMGPLARAQVLELVGGRVPVDLSHLRQHLDLVAAFLEVHVTGRPLKSIRFVRDAFPEPSEAVG